VGLEPVMLTVVMMRVPPSCQGVAGSDESQTHECLRWDGAGGSGSVDGDPSERRDATLHVVSPDQCADDPVEGFGLASLATESGVPADHGTAVTAPARKTPAAHQ
jgi:hypothetical protein